MTSALPALPSAYTSPTANTLTALPQNAAAQNTRYGKTSDKGDEARFGACDPCSCPCSCLSGLFTAGAIALAGLGLIKLGPQLIKSAGKLFSPEVRAKLTKQVQNAADSAKNAVNSTNFPNP